MEKIFYTYYEIPTEYNDSLVEKARISIMDKENCNKIGLRRTIDFMMLFALKNKVETGCFYNYKTGKVLTDVVKGTAFSTKLFYTNLERHEMRKIVGNGCHFHVHWDDFDMFSETDLTNILQQIDYSGIKYYYSVGIPKKNKILYLDSKKIDKRKYTILSNFLFKAISDFKDNFKEYCFFKNGELCKTEKGKILEKNQIILIKKILKNIIKIEKWK